MVRLAESLQVEQFPEGAAVYHFDDMVSVELGCVVAAGDGAAMSVSSDGLAG